MFERSCKRFILPDKANTQQSVPLKKIYIRKRVFGLYSNDATLDLWRRLKVVLSDFDEMINLRKQLNIHTQPTVQIRSRFCYQPLSKFLLEHQYSAPEYGFLCKQFKHKRRTDLIGNVSHTYVEERQLYSQNISRNQGEFVSVFRILKPFRELCNHSGIDLNGDYFFSFFEQECSQITSSRPNLKDYICRSNRRFYDHLVEDMSVYEDVLAIGFVEHHPCSVYGLLFLYHLCCCNKDYKNYIKERLISL